MCSCRSVALRVTDDEREQSEHASSLLNQKKQQQKLNKNIISLFFVLFVFPDLDLNLSLSGKVVKKVGEALSVQTEKSGSGDVKVSWTKVTEKT